VLFEIEISLASVGDTDGRRKVEWVEGVEESSAVQMWMWRFSVYSNLFTKISVVEALEMMMDRRTCGIVQVGSADTSFENWSFGFHFPPNFSSLVLLIIIYSYTE
jgi:hypothetical protein